MAEVNQRSIDGVWNAIARVIGIFPPTECANHFANAGYASGKT